MKHLILYSVLLFTVNVYSQKSSEPCCTIIDMSAEEGTFTIRDKNSGRIQLFKPDALEGAELKVGDTIDAMFETKKITSVKGVTRSYDLLEAKISDTCCIILKLDSLADAPSFIVTARNNTSGENIRFIVPGTLASGLSAGEIVYMQPTHGYAMFTAAADSASKTLYGFPLLQEKPK